MIDVFAQAVGAQHITAGTEGTLVQALDRLGVVLRLGQNGQGKLVHDGQRFIAFSSEVDTGSREENASVKKALSFGAAAVHRRRVL